jgi:hypothetical protein
MSLRFPMLLAGLLVVAAGPARAAISMQAPLPNPQPMPPPVGAPLPPPPQQQPAYPPPELDRIVSPIALYPDPLLAQVLAGATYAEQIPDAARWADEHHRLTGAALTAAIAADAVPWDPSVQALLPFPSVLEMMASAMPWTEEIGNAFLAQPQEVMDAVQRMRQAASQAGYLRSNAQVVVRTGPFIEIQPVNPYFVPVPFYDPALVFVAPRPGLLVRPVGFGFGITVGPAFAAWGWGVSRFDWGAHALIINNARWERTWANRAVYVHPYTVRRAVAVPRAVETHRPAPRTQKEREEERRKDKR